MAAGLHDFYGLCIATADEGGAADVLQACAQAFVNKLVEEAQITSFIFEHFVDKMLDKGFCYVHVSFEVAEGDFGLNHPELGGMACGVAVFCAEGGAKGVDVAQRAGVGFAFKLPRDGQGCHFAKEVAFIALVFGQWVEGGNVEHLARAFAV